MSDLSRYIEGLSPEKRELFELLLQEKKASRAPTISKREDAEAFPLSFAQQRLWFLDQWEPGSPVYNLPQAVRLQGQLDLAVLQKTLNEIVRRHETLRATFAAVDGQPVQKIAPQLTVSLPLINLCTLSEAERELQAQRLMSYEARQPFNLATGPLLRATLLQLGQDDWIMLLTLHHIVSDGWSNGVLVRELGALYPAFSEGRPAVLPELELQYADFAQWQRQWLRGEVLEKQLAYWKQQLAGAPPLVELPTDYVRPPISTFSGARHWVQFSKSLTEALKALGQREGASLFMTLLAAFKVLLYRYTSQQDIVVGSPIANRNRAEIEGLIGFFVNTLVLRTKLSGTLTFRELLGRVREVALGAQDHQDLPFEKLVDELHVERDTSRAPLFQVMFALQNAPFSELKGPGLTIRPLQIDSGTAQFDLSLDLYEAATGLQGWFEYNTDLFQAATIVRLAGHFQTLLEEIVAQPERPIADLPLLPETEKQQLLVTWNDTATPYDRESCLSKLFEAQAAQTPDAVAVVFEDHSLTYRKLDRRANQLAHYLCKLNVGPDVQVGICVERSLELVIGLLGILKAGGAYVPLDPSYPSERLAFILQEVQVPVLLTQTSLLGAGVLPPLACPVICLDSDWEDIGAYSDLPLPARVQSDNLAYVLYTSGSTGKPKGVMISHRAICNHMFWLQATFPLDCTDSVLQKTPFNFDASVWEFYAPLMSGARLVLARPGGHKDSAYLVKTIVANEITTLQLVPSLLNLLLQEPQFGTCRCLKRVFCGGEALSSELIEGFHACLSADLCNLYGPTEATIDTTFWECQRSTPSRSVPIGRPIANTQLYILDERRQPVPIGIAGELFIGGDGLARGYLNRPDLTVERFVPNPFETTADDNARRTPSSDVTSFREPRLVVGSRLYRTGDLARYRPDGTIEFLERMDYQIKIRGFRVELGEIEAVLAQHPAVRGAVVLARPQPSRAGQGAEAVQAPSSAELRLVAYLVPNATEPLVIAQVRRFLQEKLPDYMVPTSWVTLAALPLTPNGKIDRRALPEQFEAEPTGEFVAPRTDTETILANILTQVLGIAQIGVHDNFFDLGGHSLLATQVMTRICRTFQVDLPLRTLFDHPTIARLAVQVRSAQQAVPGMRTSSVLPIPRTAPIPLSFAQEQLWVVDQIAPGNVAYLIPATGLVQGPLDLTILQQCFDAIAERHEIFRTTYTSGPNYPVQTINPPAPVPLALVDLRGVPNPKQEAEHKIAEAASYPINLARGPLVKGFLFRVADQEYVVLMLMPHIVTDEWSSNLILNEMQELYQAFSEQRLPVLPPLSIQYADYAHWQRQWLQGEMLEKSLDYWRGKLAGAPAWLDLPDDWPRPPVQRFRGEHLTVPVPEDIASKIRGLGRQIGATPFMTMLAAFETLLYHYSGQTDMVIGTPIANRNHQEVEQLIGYFLNVLVLRTDLSGNPTFSELLERVRDTCLEAYAHQDLYFEKLVQDLEPRRDLSRNPLFTVMFIYRRNYPPPDLTFSDLTLSYFATQTEVARRDLTMYVFDSTHGLTVQLNYNTDLFKRSTASRMLEQFMRVLGLVVTNPAWPIETVPLLSEMEQQQILSEWNATRADYARDTCIHELFEAQADRTPQAIAALFEDESLTYQELEAQANQLAHHLKSLGVHPGEYVAVYLRRALEVIPALLGILKAGGAYVPIETSFPSARVEQIARSLGVHYLITQSQQLEAIQALHLPTLQHVICLDPELAPPATPDHALTSVEPMRVWSRAEVEQHSRQRLPIQASPDDLAYVIFTSGSTGTPKGVMVQHRPVINLIEWINRTFAMGSSDRVLFITSLCFDLSVYDIFGLLAAGGSIQIVSDQDLQEPQQLLRWLPKSITFWDSAPAALQQLTPFFNSVNPSHEDCRLRLVFMSGDWIPVTLPDRVRETWPGVQVVSLGGATEATVWSNYYVISQVDPAWASIPYGKPIQNARYYILDAHLNPSPIGVPGDLYIGGECLSLGYANEPRLTAAKYLPDPFSELPGVVMYRTGDRARFWPDGNIEFLGRLDFQVKIRGYRIELGEIETTLAQHPGLRENLVVAQEVEAGARDKRLVAYLIPQPGQELSLTELRLFLKDRLPEYMIPAAFVTLQAFPLTPNGKIDRQALPRPDQVRPELQCEYVPPRNAVEEMVAHLWAQVLQLDRVGIYDNFFELGGHSLSAIQIHSRLTEVFQVELPLRRLFEGPSVAAVAAALLENEPVPGQSEKIAQIWKRVELAPETELMAALGHKNLERADPSLYEPQA